MSDADSLNRELIRVIQTMTTELHQVRADVNRAINPLYQRIVAAEQTQRRDNNAREAHRRDVDEVLAAIRADVEAVRLAGRWRGWQMWAQLVLLLLLAIGIAVLIFLLWRMVDQAVMARLLTLMWR